MKIGICNDHGATELKFSVLKHLQNNGYEVVNYGTDNKDSCDYPLCAIPLCKAIQNGEIEYGIAMCTTGIGISIACNKHKGIRACCCSETKSASLTRQHNNANVICFGASIVSEQMAFDIVDTFLTTPFSEGERHIRRVNEISEIEQGQ